MIQYLPEIGAVREERNQAHRPTAQRSLPGRTARTTAERFTAFKTSAWGLLLIVIVMGGIYTGLFTLTEAAAMSAAPGRPKQARTPSGGSAVRAATSVGAT